MEGLSESLAAEVAPLGIEVTTSNPPHAAPIGPEPSMRQSATAIDD
ncbi:hypothetical protein [Streptomyces chartreusis]